MDCPNPFTRPELGTECVDPEACQSGWPCKKVRSLAHPMKESEMANYEKIDPESERIREALKDWWLEQSRQEIEAVVPKAVEYGSTDLAVIGRTMGRLMGRNGDLSHEEATEIGIYFYLVGKLARWEDAIINGRRVSDDTLHDASVYIKMQQRNRAVGGWPFAPHDKEDSK